MRDTSIYLPEPFIRVLDLLVDELKIAPSRVEVIRRMAHKWIDILEAFEKAIAIRAEDVGRSRHLTIGLEEDFMDRIERVKLVPTRSELVREAVTICLVLELWGKQQFPPHAGMAISDDRTISPIIDALRKGCSSGDCPCCRPELRHIVDAMLCHKASFQAVQQAISAMGIALSIAAIKAHDENHRDMNADKFQPENMSSMGRIRAGKEEIFWNNSWWKVSANTETWGQQNESR